MYKRSRIALRTTGAVFSSVVLFLLSVVSVEAEELTRVVEEPLVMDGVSGQRGGRLVTALSAEPRTLNPAVAVNQDSLTVIRRLMGDLIHVNRYTQSAEPALAKAWDVSDDGLIYTLRLRRGVRFSDGQPFDADDVIFSFKVYLDERVGFPNRDLLIIGGRPVEVRKVDVFTVEFRLAKPYAIGDRLFDSVAILPHHLLSEAYQKGKLREAWAVTTSPKEIAGLGPFRLKQYIPGERCVLERNPYYWKTDRLGNRLPYLDDLTFLFATSDATRTLLFQAGDTDIVEDLSAEDFLTLKQRKASQPIRLLNLGPGLVYSFLFFNLNESSGKLDSTVAEKQVWFRQKNFRKAISAAIDREGLVRLVYGGKASSLWSINTPGSKRWLNENLPAPRRSLVTSRELLTTAGFGWDESRRLVDSKGVAVEFSIITSAGNSQRLQMATIIQSDLSEVGIAVQIVPIEHRSLVDRVVRSHDYEACILALNATDADPNAQMPVLLSNGSLHFWNLGQTEPATPWEAEIDRLMQEQTSVVDFERRKKLFDSVQELMSEYAPLVLLVSPHVLVGAKRDLGNFRPATLYHATLWNVDQLYWRQGRQRGER